MSGDAQDGGRDRSDFPPSARFVLDVLENERRLSRQQLLARTGLPESTLDDAMGVISNRVTIHKTADPDDMRQIVYEIRD